MPEQLVRAMHSSEKKVIYSSCQLQRALRIVAQRDRLWLGIGTTSDIANRIPLPTRLVLDEGLSVKLACLLYSNQRTEVWWFSHLEITDFGLYSRVLSGPPSAGTFSSHCLPLNIRSSCGSHHALHRRTAIYSPEAHCLKYDSASSLSAKSDISQI